MSHRDAHTHNGFSLPGTFRTCAVSTCHRTAPSPWISFPFNVLWLSESCAPFILCLLDNICMCFAIELAVIARQLCHWQGGTMHVEVLPLSDVGYYHCCLLLLCIQHYLFGVPAWPPFPLWLSNNLRPPMHQKKTTAPPSQTAPDMARQGTKRVSKDWVGGKCVPVPPRAPTNPHHCSLNSSSCCRGEEGAKEPEVLRTDMRGPLVTFWGGFKRGGDNLKLSLFSRGRK